MFISSLGDSDSHWSRYFAKPPKVLLNGAEINHVIEVEDGLTGRLVRHVVDQHGDFVSDGDEFKLVEERGRVEFAGQRIGEDIV